MQSRQFNLRRVCFTSYNSRCGGGGGGVVKRLHGVGQLFLFVYLFLGLDPDVESLGLLGDGIVLLVVFALPCLPQVGII